MYLTYEEYKALGGNIDEASFSLFERRAEAIIDKYTFDRLHSVDFTEQPERTQESVKYCIIELVKVLTLKDSAMTLGDRENEETDDSASAISSQSNDGVSVSFNVVSAKDMISAVDKETVEIVNLYLSSCADSVGRKLTYRGLYPNE